MMLLKPWVTISIIIQFYYGRYLEYADETPPTRNKDNFMQFLIELLLLMYLFVAWGSVQCTWSQLKVSQCRLFLAKFGNFNEILKSIHSWTRFEGWQHHSPVTRMVDLMQLPATHHQQVHEGHRHTAMRLPRALFQFSLLHMLMSACLCNILWYAVGGCL